MCGIAGFVNLRDRAAGTADLRRMMDVIAHRGPDGHGIYRGWHGVSRTPAPQHHRCRAAGISRWPTKTESVGSSTTARSSTMPICGRRSKRAGHRYKTRCDTETILHAYEQYGRGLRDALPRHVRVRDLGRRTRRRCFAPATGWASSRSTTSGTAAVRVRLRDQGAAGASGDFGRASKNRAPRISGFRLHQRRAYALPRNPEADARASSARLSATGTASSSIEQYWDVPAPAGRPNERPTRSGSRSAASAWKKPSGCG